MWILIMSENSVVKYQGCVLLNVLLLNSEYFMGLFSLNKKMREGKKVVYDQESETEEDFVSRSPATKVDGHLLEHFHVFFKF